MSAQSGVPQLAQVVERAGYEDFGFLVIRTGYGNEAQWEQWAEEFNNMIERSVVESPGNEETINKLMMAMIDDPELHGASWDSIQVFFDDCQDNNMVPPGADAGFCLAVDHEAMESLLNPKSGEDPWVWAVDTTYDFEGAQAGDGYPGYIKVAITSVVTEFYPLIAGSSMSRAELWSFAKPIWKHAA